MKACVCGAVHSAKDWAALPYVGVVDTPADAFGPREVIELRNCVCGSTIAVDITPGVPRLTRETDNGTDDNGEASNG